MKHSSSNSKSAHRQRLWLLVLSRGGLAVGGFLLLGIFGGTWLLRSFIRKDLAPLVEKNLTNIIDRPLNLGKVESFSLSGVKFGASAIPATAADTDKVKADAVEVGFDPLQLLFNRRLKLDITLVNPIAYVEQDEEGRWITTNIVLPEKPGPIAIDIERVRLRNGNVALIPSVQDKETDKQTKKIPPTSPRVVFSELDGYAK